ncbi:hypothetical protein [Spirosoma sp. KNUC1025]|uniref:hypothetical protein n=1 Tax=Spirosoma sp. KNUC1025 TaxID=2894082 RepID=UPI003866F68F|nr:hypothetical protein LN737_00595 [Spirosoma sp. KNUC1025]
MIADGSKQDLEAFDKARKEILANEETNAAFYTAMIKKRGRDRNALVVDQIFKQSR